MELKGKIEITINIPRTNGELVLSVEDIMNIQTEELSPEEMEQRVSDKFGPQAGRAFRSVMDQDLEPKARATWIE